jgi:hypothetical protein
MKKKSRVGKKYQKAKKYTMIQIRPAQLPPYIQDSLLCQTLMEEYEEEEEIVIDKRYYTTDDTIHSYDDMERIVNMMEYFMVPVSNFPSFIYDALPGKEDAWKGTVFEEEVHKIRNMSDPTDAIFISMNCLKYIHRSGFMEDHEIIQRAIWKAMSASEIDSFAYVMENIVVNHETIMAHIHNTDCSYESGCYCAHHLYDEALWENNFECFRYLVVHGYPFQRTIGCAAITYHKDISYLKVLHENGFPMNESILFLASYVGNAECLQYAVQNGASGNKEKCLEICTRGLEHFNDLDENNINRKRRSVQKYEQCFKILHELPEH